MRVDGRAILQRIGLVGLFSRGIGLFYRHCRALLLHLQRLADEFVRVGPRLLRGFEKCHLRLRQVLALRCEKVGVEVGGARREPRCITC